MYILTILYTKFNYVGGFTAIKLAQEILIYPVYIKGQ